MSTKFMDSLPDLSSRVPVGVGSFQKGGKGCTYGIHLYETNYPFTDWALDFLSMEEYLGSLDKLFSLEKVHEELISFRRRAACLVLTNPTKKESTRSLNSYVLKRNKKERVRTEFILTNKPCHGFLNGQIFNTQTFFTVLNVSPTESVINFYDWLFKESYLSDAFLTKSGTEAFSYPVPGYFSNLNTEEHTLICGNITARTPWHYGTLAMIRVWNDLVSAGYKKDVAFHVAARFPNGKYIDLFLDRDSLACEPGYGFSFPFKEWKGRTEYYQGKYSRPKDHFETFYKGSIIETFGNKRKAVVNSSFSLKEIDCVSLSWKDLLALKYVDELNSYSIE